MENKSLLRCVEVNGKIYFDYSNKNRLLEDKLDLFLKLKNDESLINEIKFIDRGTHFQEEVVMKKLGEFYEIVKNR